jgi:hypothetical protein
MLKFIKLVLLVFAISTTLLSQEKEEEQQTPPPSEGDPSSSAMMKTVIGCVVQSEQGFILKTDSDSYPIETDRDLSRYTNKQVKVTGILEHEAAAPSPQKGSPAVVTDIRLRMIATVIGDCNQPSK